MYLVSCGHMVHALDFVKTLCALNPLTSVIWATVAYISDIYYIVSTILG